MKKFAMAVVAAASLGTAFADSCANSFTGFYAGVQAGMNSTTGTLKAEGLFDTNLTTTTTTRNVNLGKKSFLGGLFVGYGMGVGSCAYVGAEFYGNFGNTGSTLFDQTDDAGSNKFFKVSMSRKYNLGAKVRLGYTVSQQAMIFVGLGLEYAKTQLQVENIQSDAANPAAQVGVTGVTKKNKGKISFAPSIGMDVFLNKNLFVRGEYTYVMGIKQTVTAANGNIAGAAQAKTNANFKLNASQQRFALGLGYKF